MHVGFQQARVCSMQVAVEMRFLEAERGDCGVGLTWTWGLRAELRQSRNRCDGLQVVRSVVLVGCRD